MLLRELENRWNRCRALLKNYMPRAEGIIVFSRLNIYYLSGTFGNGIFWLPADGKPVLLCRRGQDRAGLESPVEDIFPFRLPRAVAMKQKDSGREYLQGGANRARLTARHLSPWFRVAVYGHVVRAGPQLADCFAAQAAAVRKTASAWRPIYVFLRL
ncbi:MAG: aminopeptidase P family N-terminal domain-containing protein [Desulfobulbaceae bacterium]|nr:aminopeptidase P family N-terminal domain-containing protein [Desulfobulbaceae bacterium]